VAGNQAMVANREQQREFVDTSGSAMLQGMASRLTDSAANIPDVLANLAARSVNNAAQVPDFMNPANYQQGGGDVRNFQQQQPLIPVPTLGQEFVPGPQGSDILGLAQRLGEGAAAVTTGNFNQFRPDAGAQQQARTDAMQQQSPQSFWLGQIGGDIMTMMTARAPIASGRARSHRLSELLAARASRKAPTIAGAPNTMAVLKSVTNKSQNTRTLLNRAGRIGEAGLEGFTLAALNGQADPLETAAFAAGTQAAGSVMLTGMAGMTSGSLPKVGLNMAVTAVGIGALAQILKIAAPGGSNILMDSFETGFDKVALGLAAGVVAGGSGLGRVTNNFPVRAWSSAADILTSMPRAATLSILTEVLDDPAAEAVITKLSTDPMYFGPSSLRRMERAFVDEKVSLSTTIEDLMNDREFRQKFEALQ
jgi:hypothetical protein